jgi:urease accessory protein
VLLNTAGGLTGNDVIRWSATAHTDSRLSITTAACEKLYRTHGPQARQDTTLRIEKGARLDWLPQETIVFDGAALKRSLTVHAAADASTLLVESFVLGRRAMQESVVSLNLEDQWRIFRDDRLLHAEALRLVFNAGSDAQQASMLHQYSAIATVLLVAPYPMETLTLLAERIRRLIPHDRSSLTAAASAMDHRLVIRALANSGLSLRQFLIPCIEQLNDGIAIPQVWNV